MEKRNFILGETKYVVLGVGQMLGRWVVRGTEEKRQTHTKISRAKNLVRGTEEKRQTHTKISSAKN